MAYTTINKSSEHFNTKLYSGNGGTQTISSVGFQPDFTWLKKRNGTGYHFLVDAVRGAPKTVFSNDTSAEVSQVNGLTAFNSDGFAVGSNSTINGNSDTFASWNWKANGAGSSNTDGTITSTVSANTTAGFSIATWSGTGSNGSIGHGLGGVDCMIIKDLSNSRDFYFWQKTMAYNTRLELNNTEAFTTNTDNMTALPDATKINMAVSTQNNGSGNNYVGYFFQEKQGYSKFGRFTANGNADNAFVYCGFKPAWVMMKCDDTTDGWSKWYMFDTARSPENMNIKELEANGNSAESGNGADYAQIDMLSNGFKIRNGSSWGPASSGKTNIYMAFAEAPLVGSNNVPCTAR